MMYRKTAIKCTLNLLMAVVICSCQSSVSYETVDGDPFNTQIYTLDNGLKVFMSVNHDEPRIQTYIAVRTGGKNDPSDNTGLAHYLEHIMFKGTEQYGTSDYQAEKPLLDEIESLFEQHKAAKDPAERKRIYHLIDSVSYQASLLAIPNEYDKLMSTIGSRSSNAFTSTDVTCYMEDIPSNRIEEWADVQADRFKNLVIRGFHTELETVYEEYNMYLNEDGENAQMALDSVLFKNHPYGLQSVIGTSDHLKNPSITAIKRQKATFYVPNNTAICLSGDFEPDEMVRIIEKYFGDWQPNESLVRKTWPSEQKLTSSETRTVSGTDAEFVLLGWRTPGGSDPESDITDIIGAILQNGSAGLLDQDITQKQALLEAYASFNNMTDYGELRLEGYPKQGQSLTEVRDILLEEVKKLKSGDFAEKLIDAALANLKLSQMQDLQRNSSRAMNYVSAFVDYRSWQDVSGKLDRLSKVTKQDIMDWVNRYVDDNAYACVFKVQGVNPKNEKIEAPAITPIATNRDKESAFLRRVQDRIPAPIEPRFVDYDNDLAKFSLSDGVDVLYTQDAGSGLGSLELRFDEGLLMDPYLELAFNYLDYLSTPSMDSKARALEQYSLASQYSLSGATSSSSVTLSGLDENLPRLLDVTEDLMLNAQGDETVLSGLKQDLLSARRMSKLSQSSCNTALRTYLTYGPEYIKKRTLSDKQIMEVTSEQLLSKVRGLLDQCHRVLYCGPMSQDELVKMLEAHHKVPANPRKVEPVYPEKLLTTSQEVYIAPYDSRQFNYTQVSCKDDAYQPEAAPIIELYNNYFGGGMNAVVFQEMREARGLAYTARANFSSPTTPQDRYQFYAMIGSQNDKLQIAAEAFDDIINNMPESQKAFDIAKSSLDAVLRTQRVMRSSILQNYLKSELAGRTEPVEKQIFRALDGMTLDELMEFQRTWIKGRKYSFGLLGDASGMDMDFLKTLGPIHFLTLEDIFGY